MTMLRLGTFSEELLIDTTWRVAVIQCFLCQHCREGLVVAEVQVAEVSRQAEAHALIGIRPANFRKNACRAESDVFDILALVTPCICTRTHATSAT